MEKENKKTNEKTENILKENTNYSEKIVRVELTVRYNEVDKMGIVHNSHYMIYGEQGKLKYLGDMGFPESEQIKNKYAMPVISQNTVYLKPYEAFDKVIVKTGLVQLNRVTATYLNALFNEEGELMAVNVVANCFAGMDRKAGDLKKLQPEMLKLKNMVIEDIDYMNLNKNSTLMKIKEIFKD